LALPELRIALVTQEEPFYLPTFLERLAHARESEIVAMIILRPFDESLLDVARRLYAFMGPKAFALECVHFARARALDLLNRLAPLSRPYSAADVARRHGIPVYRPMNVNSASFFETLQKQIQPTLLVSVAASQVFDEKVLGLPVQGCINVHSAPLPSYQGMLPTFWAMLHRERETAVTVHYMVKRLDAGDILMQTPVPIHPGDSLHDLIVRSKRIGAETLLEVIEQIETGRANARPMPSAGATYFTFPGREDGRRFRAQGRRIR
jgi:methionyl-tRNA formyltransferase